MELELAQETAANIMKAAKTCTEQHTGKVWISDVGAKFKLPLEDFRNIVEILWAMNLLNIARSDFSNLHPEKSAKSEVKRLVATGHFIRI
jgi:hypothetical protein